MPFQRNGAEKNYARGYNEPVRLVYANASVFVLGGGIPADHRYSNQVAFIFTYQFYGVRLKGFCPWQCMLCFYLHSRVPDGTEKDCIKVHNLLCGDCGYTTALRLSAAGHRNDLVDFHAVYSGYDTSGAFRFYFYCNHKSQRVDRGHVLVENSAEHYHYIRYGIALFPHIR